MGAFGCLFGGIVLAFFLVIAFLLVIIQKVLSIFGIRLPIEKFIRMNVGQPFNYGPQPNNQANSANSSTTTSSVTAKKQVYGDDEGEYVEFEEIKD